jgi:hypothetical protein
MNLTTPVSVERAHPSLVIHAERSEVWSTCHYWLFWQESRDFDWFDLKRKHVIFRYSLYGQPSKFCYDPIFLPPSGYDPYAFNTRTSYLIILDKLVVNRLSTAQLTAVRLPLRIHVVTARWLAKIFSLSAINLSTRLRCLELT